MRRLWILFIVGMFVFMPTVFSQAESTSQPTSDEKTEAISSALVEVEESLPEKEPEAKIVAVEVSGNRIISTHTILSKIKSQKGSNLGQKTVNEDIKRLYGTGFFEDIQLNIEEVPGGYKIIVLVKEKPIVRQIIFEGQSVFNEERLRKTLNVIEGQILDRQTIKQGVEDIRKLYSGKGFRFIEIKTEVNVDESSKEVSIIIRILEGKKYRIKEIDFEGVKSFSEKRIRKLMKTKKKKLFSSGVFKEASFQKDLDRIRFFYQKEGFLDAKVAPRFEYDREKNRIFITIIVEEGKHYITGEVNFSGNAIYPDSEIWEQLEMLPGLTYSQFYISQDIERIRTFYFENGYIDARIVPNIKLNRDTGKVDVTYEIGEGDLYFVEKVAIRGNTKTKDIVIRRELRIRPGEKFDGEKIKKSKQRLENLGYFEEVTYDMEPSRAGSNRKDLIFRVKEKRTGELSFGGGVSSIDKFIGFAEISQKNFDLLNWPRFTGGGQSLSIRAQMGTIHQDFRLSFVEPYIFNKPVSFGLDIFNTKQDNTNVDFDESRLGFSTTFSRLFHDVLRVGGGYTLERVKLSDIATDAPATVRNFDGSNWLSRVRAFTTHDTRDSVFNPHKGHLINFSSELVGSFLGGNQDYYIFRSGFSQYFSFFEKQVLEIGMRLATSQEFGDSNEVPVFDRFYAGGLGTVRGFNYRRVGPIENGSAIGGQTMAIVNFDYTFPIPYLDAFRGVVFMDLGHVNRDSYRLDFGKFSASIGPGIKVKTPIGPLAFYYGFPIANKDTKDSNGRFEFSLSRSF